MKMNITEAELTLPFDLTKDPLEATINYCQKMITKKTKDPIGLVMNLFAIYVKAKEASEIYRLVKSGTTHVTYETLSFVNFYKYLPASVKDSMVNDLPELE
ncbi:MAG: hypothetical protein Q8L88_00485 [Bacteroidota bacterium]|nr:hypothetical protein [Bacteroidota bacterium]